MLVLLASIQTGAVLESAGHQQYHGAWLQWTDYHVDFLQGYQGTCGRKPCGLEKIGRQRLKEQCQMGEHILHNDGAELTALISIT